MRVFGRRTRSEVSVYFTGGSTAVLYGWRDTTLDIDLRFEPDPDELYRAIPEIKESLQLNVELAAPSDFIPELPGWQDRCQYIGREGSVSFFHSTFIAKPCQRSNADTIKTCATSSQCCEMTSSSGKSSMHYFFRSNRCFTSIPRSTRRVLLGQ